MSEPTRTLAVRITESEYEAFCKLATECGRGPTQHLQHLIRMVLRNTSEARERAASLAWRAQD